MKGGNRFASLSQICLSLKDSNSSQFGSRQWRYSGTHWTFPLTDGTSSSETQWVLPFIMLMELLYSWRGLNSRAYHMLCHYPHFPMVKNIFGPLQTSVFRFSISLICEQEDQSDYPVENGFPHSRVSMFWQLPMQHIEDVTLFNALFSFLSAHRNLFKQCYLNLLKATLR